MFERSSKALEGIEEGNEGDEESNASLSKWGRSKEEPYGQDMINIAI